MTRKRRVFTGEFRREAVALRERSGRPPAPVTIMTPEALRLTHEPAADCARYDRLRTVG